MLFQCFVAPKSGKVTRELHRSIEACNQLEVTATLDDADIVILGFNNQAFKTIGQALESEKVLIIFLLVLVGGGSEFLEFHEIADMYKDKVVIIHYHRPPHFAGEMVVTTIEATLEVRKIFSPKST